MLKKNCPVCFGSLNTDLVRCPRCGWDFPAASGETLEAARWLLSRIAEARVIWHSRKARGLNDEEQDGFFLKVTPPGEAEDAKDSPNVGLRVVPKLKLVKSRPSVEVNSLDMAFVPIDKGTFIMGADDNDSEAQEYEKPAHEVVVSRSFFLAKCLVTQEQWEAIMGYNPSFFKGAQRPVENISWNEAREFIKRLNYKEGLDRHRLVTEAEWEYAAKAGERTIFTPDSHCLNQYSWHTGNSGGETHRVGLLNANAWGLKDMLGNVWEWVYDWFGDYSEEPILDPLGPNEGSDKVIRGGAWGSAPWLCRVVTRSVKGPEARSPLIGLRLALDEDLKSREEFLIFAADK
jgi:formylglycine-generating enzyme required for sulfatase activity